MSWKATAYVDGLTEGLSRSEKLVMFIIADHHNPEKGIAWPSVPRIANRAMLTEQHTYRVLRSLENKGFITKVQGGGRASNQYTFPGLEIDPQQNVTPNIDVGGALTSPLRRTDKEPSVDDDQSQLRTQVIKKSRSDLPLREAYEQTVQRHALINPIGAANKYWAASGTPPGPDDWNDVDFAIGLIKNFVKVPVQAPMPSWLLALGRVGNVVQRKSNSRATYRALHSVKVHTETPDSSLLTWVATHADEFLGVLDSEIASDPGR